MTHKAAAHSTTSNSGDKDPSSSSTIILDLLDTAWRIAIPVVLLAVVGIAIDNSHDTGPWCTLVGVVIGFGVAGYMIKSELQTIERQEAAKATATTKKKGSS